MQQQNQLTCQHTGCGASFARQDNLSRHLESHLADRPYKCTLCLAAFSRKDTLIRHSSVHGEKAYELKEHLAKQSTRSSQACQACSKAKQRCQGSFPCERCQQKQIPCCFNRNGKRSFANYAYDLNHSEQSTSSDSGPLETNEASIPPEPALFGAISETLPTSGVFSNIELPPADSLLSTAFGAAPEQGTNGFNHVVDPNFHYQWDPALDLTESPLFWTSHGDVFDNSSWSGTGLAPTTNVQRTGLSLDCGNVQSTQIYDVVHFPTLLPEDHDILLSENVRHVRRISYSAYEAIERFSHSQQEQQQSLFPPIQALHAFCDLYFEHIDPLFPFVHPSFIEKDEAYWILLLAVASIGATCSAISVAEEYTSSLQELLERAIQENVPQHPEDTTLEFLQALLLREINRTFSNSKIGPTKLRYERNLMFTLQAALSSKRRRLDRTRKAQPGSWYTLLDAQAHVRLDCCIHRLECLQLYLIDHASISQHGEIPQRPLSDHLWKCRDPDEWSSIRQTYQDTSVGCTFATTTQVMLSIADERSIRSKMASSTVSASRLSFSFGSHIGDAEDVDALPSPVSQNETGTAFGSSLLTSKLDSLLSPTGRLLFEPTVTESSKAILHVMAILRSVRLRSLHHYHGWQADEHEIKEAEDSLRTWMQQDKAVLRTCIWHAASTFRILRSKDRLVLYEPFLLLISVLVIRAYCMLASATSQQDSPDEERTPERIDQLTEKTAIRDWIAGDNCSMHLTGVGILLGPRSSLRLLTVLRDMLLAHEKYSPICKALAFSVERAMAGKRPVFREDAE